MDNFQKVDKYGQQKVVNQLHKIFNGYNLNITQHYLDKSTVDINMYVTTPTGNKLLYNMEAKDRTYTHNQFGEWFIEDDKYRELMARNGKAYYVNTFRDNWLTIWDLTKIDISTLKSEYRYLPKCTLNPEWGKVNKLVYYLPNNLACYSSTFI